MHMTCMVWSCCREYVFINKVLSRKSPSTREDVNKRENSVIAIFSEISLHC